MLHDPALSNGGNDDSGSPAATPGHPDARPAARSPPPGLHRTSNGYLGTSDGWTDLQLGLPHGLDLPSAPDGNVVQTGRTGSTGSSAQRMTLVLGFGADGAAARSTAARALARGFDARRGALRPGWHELPGGLKPPPGLRARAPPPTTTCR